MVKLIWFWASTLVMLLDLDVAQGKDAILFSLPRFLQPRTVFLFDAESKVLPRERSNPTHPTDYLAEIQAVLANNNLWECRISTPTDLSPNARNSLYAFDEKPLVRNTHHEAWERIKRLPSPLQEQYRKSFEPLAARALDHFVDSHSYDGIAYVARAYRGTDSAREAMALLLRQAMDLRRYSAAARLSQLFFDDYFQNLDFCPTLLAELLPLMDFALAHEQSNIQDPRVKHYRKVCGISARLSSLPPESKERSWDLLTVAWPDQREKHPLQQIDWNALSFYPFQEATKAGANGKLGYTAALMCANIWNEQHKNEALSTFFTKLFRLAPNHPIFSELARLNRSPQKNIFFYELLGLASADQLPEWFDVALAEELLQAPNTPINIRVMQLLMPNQAIRDQIQVSTYEKLLKSSDYDLVAKTMYLLSQKAPTSSELESFLNRSIESADIRNDNANILRHLYQLFPTRDTEGPGLSAPLFRWVRHFIEQAHCYSDGQLFAIEEWAWQMAIRTFSRPQQIELLEACPTLDSLRYLRGQLMTTLLRSGDLEEAVNLHWDHALSTESVWLLEFLLERNLEAEKQNVGFLRGILKTDLLKLLDHPSVAIQNIAVRTSYYQMTPDIRTKLKQMTTHKTLDPNVRLLIEDALEDDQTEGDSR